MKQRLLAATSLLVAAAVPLAAPAGAETRFFMRTTTPNAIAQPKPEPLPEAPAPAPTGPALTYAGTEASVGYPMNATPSFDGAVGSVRFSILKGKLPAGLAIDPDTGAITGNPAAATEVTLSIQAEDAETKARSVANVTLRLLPLDSVAGALPRVTQGGEDVTGAAYDVLPGTLTGAVSPTLVTFDRYRTADTVQIAGPGAAYPWTLEAETVAGWVTAVSGSGAGAFALPGGTTARSFRLAANGQLATLRILAGGSAPYAPSVQDLGRLFPVMGEPLSLPLTADNTEGPLRWSVVSGALPPGIALGEGGTLSGAAEQVGLYQASVAVADGRASSAAAPVSLSVQAAEMARALFPSAVSAGTVAAIHDASTDTATSLPGGALEITYPRPVRANTATVQAETGGVYLELDVLDPPSGQWRKVGNLGGSGTVQGTYPFEEASASSWRLRAASGMPNLRTFRLGNAGDAPIAPGVSKGQMFDVMLDAAIQSGAIQAVNTDGQRTFTAPAGLLPPGTRLEENGSFAGTPTATGSYTFPVRVADPRGVVSEPQDVTVTVQSPYTASVDLPLTVAGSADVRTALYDASPRTTYAFNNGTFADFVFARDVKANVIFIEGNFYGNGIKLQYQNQNGAFVDIMQPSSNGWNMFPDTSAKVFRVVNNRGLNYNISTLKIGTWNTAPATPAVNSNVASNSMTVGKAATPFVLSSTDAGYDYAYEVVSGALPPGVNPPDQYGQIVGTATAAGTYNFSVVVRNKTSQIVSAPLALQVSVIEPPKSAVPRADRAVVLTALDRSTAPSNDSAGYLSALYDRDPNTSLTFYDNYYSNLLRLEWNSAPAQMDCAIISGNSGTGYVTLYAGSFQTGIQISADQTINFGRKVNTNNIYLQKAGDTGRWGRYTDIYEFKGGNMVNGTCVTP